MKSEANKSQRRRSKDRRARDLPWADPTVGDVHGWLREAFDNVADARSSGARRLRRAGDAVRYAGILLATWVDPEYSATANDNEVQSICWRVEQLVETLLHSDQLSGSWSEQAYKVKAAIELGSVLTMIRGYNVLSVSSAREMIRTLRRTATTAARFSASAGAAALLESAPGVGGGTDAAAEAAHLASVLFRGADDQERRFASLH